MGLWTASECFGFRQECVIRLAVKDEIVILFRNFSLFYSFVQGKFPNIGALLD